MAVADETGPVQRRKERQGRDLAAGVDPRLVVVELEPTGRLKKPVTLAEIKALPAFAQSPLVRQGRLSVVPLTKAQWKAVRDRAAR